MQLIQLFSHVRAYQRLQTSVLPAASSSATKISHNPHPDANYIIVKVCLSRLPETDGQELPPAVIMKLDVEGKVG